MPQSELSKDLKFWQSGEFTPRNVATGVKIVLQAYFVKFRGRGEGIFPPHPSLRVLIGSFAAAFTGIALCAFLTYNVGEKLSSRLGSQMFHPVFLVGSFGATAVLIYGTVDSPLAQPRNVLGGHFLSGVVGVFVAEMFALGGMAYPTDNTWLWAEAGLAVSLSITAMQLTRTTHPPGGATALIAVTSSKELRMHGLYVLIPILSGVLIMLTVALVINNIARQYPLYWWKPTVYDVPVPDYSEHGPPGETYQPHPGRVHIDAENGIECPKSETVHHVLAVALKKIEEFERELGREPTVAKELQRELGLTGPILSNQPLSICTHEGEHPGV